MGSRRQPWKKSIPPTRSDPNKRPTPNAPLKIDLRIADLPRSDLLPSTKTICAIDAGAAMTPQVTKTIPHTEVQFNEALTIFNQSFSPLFLTQIPKPCFV